MIRADFVTLWLSHIAMLPLSLTCIPLCELLPCTHLANHYCLLLLTRTTGRRASAEQASSSSLHQGC
eukprot:11683-Heterococcus_DN1.PRE.2